jgi:hypothetical protein
MEERRDALLGRAPARPSQARSAWTGVWPFGSLGGRGSGEAPSEPEACLAHATLSLQNPRCDRREPGGVQHLSPQGSRIRLRLRRSFALLTELRPPMLYSPIRATDRKCPNFRDVRERVQVRRPAFPPSFIFHRLACRKEDRKFSHGGHGDHGGNLSCRSKACVGFQPCLAINHSNNPKQTLITNSNKTL